MQANLILALQLIACGFTAAATWLIGNKSTSGPWCNIVAALLFALVNLTAGLWVCAAFSAAMAALNTRNYLRWRLEKLGKLT